MMGSGDLSEDVPVILVIEDEEAIQSLVEDALTEGGFEPAIAASGEEAVTLLKGRSGNYRALVTDIGLRGKMDGWAGPGDRAAVSRRLHERRKRR
jgi:DNA-binding response OmpR family regulator